MQRHRWQTCSEAGSWGEGMTKGGNSGPENRSSIKCQVLGNDYTMAALSLSHFPFSVRLVNHNVMIAVLLHE